MASVIEEIEDNLIARLAPLISAGAVVQATPENQAEFIRFFEKPGIVIAFKESEQSEPKSVNAISQDDTLQFEMYIFQSKLRGDMGTYDIYERIRKLLMGYRPVTVHHGRFKKIWFNNFKPKELDENMWVYCATISTEGMVVEDTDTEGYNGQSFPTFVQQDGNPYGTADTNTGTGTEGINPDNPAD